MDWKEIISEEDINTIVEKRINDFLFARCLENADNEQMVEEALIYSYDVNFVHRKICELFNLALNPRVFLRNQSEYLGFSVIRKSKNKCSVILLALPKDNTYILKNITLKMEKAYGWFLACRIDSPKDDIECWQFEKKKENDATFELKQHNHLYHMCPTSRLQKILHVGLLPKKTTWEPYMLDDEHTFVDEHNQHYGWKTVDRVYAFLSKPSDEFIKDNDFKEKRIFTDTYTLLEIDTIKLLSGTKIMYDPRHENAIYTMANIPSAAISVYNSE